MEREEREQIKQLAREIAMQVINDYNANHNKPIKPKSEETAPDLKDRVRALNKKYQEHIQKKLVSGLDN